MIKPIEVFVRHCHFSEVSVNKKRFDAFTRKGCYDNLIATLNPELVNVTFLLDTFHPSQDIHFVKQQTRFPIVTIEEGTETGSFLKLLDYVMGLNLSDETIVYFLEDDYLHRPKWGEVMLEGFSLPEIDYMTLYDHRDKYFASDYKKLTSKLYHTASCHWRTTPSTTNTYAMRFKTLKKHLKYHKKYSLGCRITRDHQKFCKLTKKGAQLISAVPGFATHAEPAYASPCFEWESLF
jgi:hypothetical protein